ncbi:MAG: hypothetical protein BGO31_16155 [Bacteroidetes bacterium 43-16]|nr:MAG: hypothetical protein BGO31_16155 [Bacteroidetes bacterium 43-16]
MQLSSLRFDTGNLELLAKQVVEGFIIGLHKSPFHGFSVEFAEHRVYNAGDNLRHIDWKVFARRDKMFIKKFEEETNLRCRIAIDISRSMSFPETGISKIQFACLGAASIMQLLRKQLDAAGLSLFADKVYWSSPLKSSERHHKSLIVEMERLLAQDLTHSNTNLPDVLHEIAETSPQRSLVILFSDFMDDISREQDFYTALQHLKFSKQEVIIFQVGDGKKEWDFEFENRPYEFVDLETQARIRLKPAEVKVQYLEALNAYHKRLEQQCLKFGIDLIRCDIHTDMEHILQSYLIRRNKLM